MQQGTACDFGRAALSVTAVDWPFAKRKLEHQEERVRNRYRRSYVCVAFVLVSALSLLAQSDRMEVQRRDNLQLQSDPTQSLLTAKVVESPAFDSASNGSDLPDAPSAAKPDASTGQAAAFPAVRKAESQGAQPAAIGGPLWVDRGVADRNYLLITGGMFAASIANAELTLHCLSVHTSCNDVPPSLKSRAGIYGIGIPADLAIAYLTYHMKKKHSHIWYVPAALVTGANIFFGVRAFRWARD